MATALGRLNAIARRHGLRTAFSRAVLDEVDAFLRAPGLDDSCLRDLTDQSFVTIDNEDSKDLDQALCIESVPNGTAGSDFRVFYALADAAFYVPFPSALFSEALARGVTYYFPGFAYPMLPSALSEGLVSLNPGEHRRALVFDLTLDSRGHVRDCAVYRGKILSRAKLSYTGVQKAFDAGFPQQRVFGDCDYATTLALLREVGLLRMADATERDVVRYDRTQMDVELPSETSKRLEVRGKKRLNVEQWNEQLSLLCNTEGAKFLLQHTDPVLRLEGVFRVHAAPDDESVQRFAARIKRLVAALELDEQTWDWRRAEGESLADFLERLPDDGEQARLASAIQRQALLLNQRAEFSTHARAHHGVGVAHYSRFSAPMREIIGVLTHHVAIAQLEARPLGMSRAAVDAVLQAAEESQVKQKAVWRDALQCAIDDLFVSDFAALSAGRSATVRVGTVMGLTPSKIHARLDEPPIDVKVYLRDLSELTGVRYELDEDGVRMSLRDPNLATTHVTTLGSRIELQLIGFDQDRRRWHLRPV